MGLASAFVYLVCSVLRPPTPLPPPPGLESLSTAHVVSWEEEETLEEGGKDRLCPPKARWCWGRSREATLESDLNKVTFPACWSYPRGCGEWGLASAGALEFNLMTSPVVPPGWGSVWY